MSQPARKCILLFVKAPVAGTVKTRLSDRLEPEAILALYRAFVGDFLAVLETAGCDIRIFYDPPDERARINSWLGSRHPLFPQSAGDLGCRMKAAFHETFAAGYSQAVLVGSDIPDLPVFILSASFDRLDHFPAVIGPSMDGGYYLIGFRSEGFLEEAFDKMTWSTDRVFAETVARFSAHQRPVHELARWPDIDTFEDLAALARRLRQQPGLLPETRSILERLKLLQTVSERVP